MIAIERIDKGKKNISKNMNDFYFNKIIPTDAD